MGTVTADDGFSITYSSIGNVNERLFLLVVGSSGIGSLYGRIAAELSRHFRCVYYDKRGFLPKASNPEWAAQQKNEVVSVHRQADDAAVLIKHLSPSQPAYVFGTSCGGTEVLDLVCRYPQLIHTVILHEPITFSVIRDQSLRQEMLDLYRVVGKEEDTNRGHAIFRNYMFNPPNGGPANAIPAIQSSSPTNAVELFNSRGGQCEALAMVEYNVDEGKANEVADKILLVAGSESKHLQVSKPSAALAAMLGDRNPVYMLPGGHMSFAAKNIAAEFCRSLMSLLSQRNPELRDIAGAVSPEKTSRARM